MIFPWHPDCNISLTMDTILLCSHNPILVKSLYGLLRDEGYDVETIDHPALAVRRVFEKSFRSVIFDPEPFGLSIDDAVKIIRSVAPEVLVIFIGHNNPDTEALSIDAPINLVEFRKAVKAAHRMQQVH